MTHAARIDVSPSLERRAVALMTLVAHPEWSTSRIADAAGVSRPTVNSIVREFSIRRPIIREAIRNGRTYRTKAQRPPPPRKSTRHPVTPIAAARSNVKTESQRYATKRAEAVGREVSDRVASYRMREERSTWKRIATLSALALGQFAPGDILVELLCGGDVTVEVSHPAHMRGETETLVLPDDLREAVREICGLWEEIEDDEALDDMDRAFRAMFVERVRKGEIDV